MRLTFPTLLVLALLALPSLLLAQVQQDAWKKAVQQDGITISYQAALCGDDNMLLIKIENKNAQAVVVDMALEKEENGAKAGIPPFHVRVEAHGSKVMDCQELGPHGMMPVFVDSGADIYVTTSHLHVSLF